MNAPINTALTLLRSFVAKSDSDSPLAKYRAATPQLPLEPWDETNANVNFLRTMEAQLLKKPEGYTEVLRNEPHPATDMASATFLTNLKNLQIANTNELARNGLAAYWPTLTTTGWLQQLYELQMSLPEGTYLEYVRKYMAEQIRATKIRLKVDSEIDVECKFRLAPGVNAGAPSNMVMTVFMSRRGKTFESKLTLPSDSVPVSGPATDLITCLDAVALRCSDHFTQLTTPSVNDEFFQEPTPAELEVTAVQSLLSSVFYNLSPANRSILRRHPEMVIAAL